MLSKPCSMIITSGVMSMISVFSVVSVVVESHVSAEPVISLKEGDVMAVVVVEACVAAETVFSFQGKIGLRKRRRFLIRHGSI